MLRIKNNPSLKGQAFHHPNIIYSTAGGKQISMDLLLPWTPVEDARFPLVVFIQGCGFHFPDIRGEILQLADLARAGYAVAAVTHRNISDGFPAPAFRTYRRYGGISHGRVRGILRSCGCRH